MADHADDEGFGNNNVFVYMGGNQEVPQHVTHVRIHKSVKIITWRAFEDCHDLVSVEIHDGVEIIEYGAFHHCYSLRRIKLTGVRVIGARAFCNCTALEDAEFGDKLETIEEWAFADSALRNIKIPKVRTIEDYAFSTCEQLTDVGLSEDLEQIGYKAFGNCPRLRRIAIPIPLKDNLLDEGVFFECEDLSQVDLIGGIHKTISSLLLESWRNEMNIVGRINQDLPSADSNEKTEAIQLWMETVIERFGHYKSEHYRLLKEDMTLLELALWKAKLDEEFGEALNKEDNTTAKKAKIDMKASRKEQRITSGANVVTTNVLPFLKLE